MRKPLLAVLVILAAYYAAFEAPGALDRIRDEAGYAALFGPLGPEPTAPPEAVAAAVRLEPWLDGLEMPLHLTFAPGDPAKRLFIVEKTGKIRIVKAGKLAEGSFLDVSSLVSDGGEQGLLSVAFHPKHAENGLFYVNYTDRKGDTRVVERRSSKEDPDRADAEHAKELLSVKQPYANHNGGGMAFDKEGRLWVGMGDGGFRDDPKKAGQDDATLLGKMLRLDVDAPRGLDGKAPCEVRVKGVRNPWRFSFDRASGDLYIADVGQDRWEEVHVVPGGGEGGENLGWDLFEGFHERPRRVKEARKAILDACLPPAVEYTHQHGVSITGGFVYRGAAIPELAGSYFFADYASGLLRSFRWKDGAVSDYWEWRAALDPQKRVTMVASFGEDEAGELYLVSLDGKVRRLLPARAIR